jgi:hypothetical protein
MGFTRRLLLPLGFSAGLIVGTTWSGCGSRCPEPEGVRPLPAPALFDIVDAFDERVVGGTAEILYDFFRL